MTPKERPADSILEEWKTAQEILKKRSEEKKRKKEEEKKRKQHVGKEGWSLTPSGRFVKVGTGESATTAMQEIRASEDRRQLLAALFRTLIQRREFSSEGLDTVLSVTLGKINAVLGTEAAFALLLDPTIKEANVLCATLGGRDLPPARKRRLRYLEQTPLKWSQLGLLRDVTEATLIAPVAEGTAPKPLEDVMTRPMRQLVAVPAMVSQRLTALLVAVNRDDSDGFGDPEILLLAEVAKHACRAIQRSLGLGTPLSDEETARCLALLASCEFKSTVRPDMELLEALDGKLLRRYAILPIKQLSGQDVRVAIANPLDVQSIGDFEIVSQLNVTERVATTRAEIERHLESTFPGGGTLPAKARAATRVDLVAKLAGDLSDLPELSISYLGEEVTENSAPIVRLASRLIEDAYLRGASDIHIETESTRVVVRFRIDGILRERASLPLAASRPLVARVKIMSELDVSEHRVPMDGRINFSQFNSALDIDLRVSVLPMRDGEWVCMRILEKKRSALPLSELGFSDHNLELYREIIQNPCGMILHCGPTGSGKSMTLYAALNELRTSAVKVVTAEDPIEYVLSGIGQMQINSRIGVTFAHALRSFLRHDPDIILIGEIRDPETAQIATEASLTGHLLLSTLHTNDAASSVARLVKLGIEPYLVASTILAMCAQRLVRKLCHCKRPAEPTLQERAYLKRARDDASIELVHHAAGCEQCNHIGYRGRTGAHELMALTSRLRQQISEGRDATVIKQTARNHGMRTLFEDCVQKAKSGLTTIEEVLRVSHPDDIV